MKTREEKLQRALEVIRKAVPKPDMSTLHYGDALGSRGFFVEGEIRNPLYLSSSIKGNPHLLPTAKQFVDRAYGQYYVGMDSPYEEIELVIKEFLEWWYTTVTRMPVYEFVKTVESFWEEK